MPPPFFFFTVQTQKQPSASPAHLTFEICRAQDQQKTRRKEGNQKAREKTAGPSNAHCLSCQSFAPLPSTLSLFKSSPTNPSPPSQCPRRHTHTHCANPSPYYPPVPSSLPTPVLLCTSAICTALRAASHPASH